MTKRQGKEGERETKREKKREKRQGKEGERDEKRREEGEE